MRLLRALEPLWWAAFLVGGVFAVWIPLLVLGFGLALPFAWPVEAGASFAWLTGLLDVPGARPALALAHAFVFWHAAHHLRQLLLDLGVRAQALVGWCAYLAAATGSAWSIHALWIP